MPASKKFVSKVDEKLKAAEARRAELQRAKAEEQERKQEMRKSRLCSQSSVMKSNDQLQTATQTQKVVNVRDFAYLKVSNKPKLFKLNWNAAKKEKSDEQKRKKLFTIAAVEKLIQANDYDLAEVLLGIMRRSSPARHPIQNKFAHLHGRIVEQKERTKRAFTHASALNFVGSISPVRVPEFEADLNKLSRLSSPIGMDEIAKKYENIEELSRANVAGSTVESVISTMNTLNTAMNSNHTNHANYSNFNPYDHDLIPDDYEIPPEVSATPQPKSPRKNSNAISNENDQQTNFPTVISPMKRPQKDIEAEVVYTPQRKSARRLGDDEIIYDDEQVSQLLLNDPNAAFIANPYITTPLKKNKKAEE